eukprot:SAG25_NODE_866_length_5015_cov_1.822213_3_plen_155_part_00
MICTRIQYAEPLGVAELRGEPRASDVFVNMMPDLVLNIRPSSSYEVGYSTLPAGGAGMGGAPLRGYGLPYVAAGDGGPPKLREGPLLSAEPKAAAAAVSRSCACIGSPCLRQCVHGASIGGGGGVTAGADARRGPGSIAGRDERDSGARDPGVC